MKSRLTVLAALLAAALPAAAALDVAGLTPGTACTDFYAHANATWIAATPIPADRSRWSTFDVIGERNEKILREAFEAALASPPPAGTPQRKVVDYYASGLDLAAIEKAGLTPLERQFFAIGQMKTTAELAKLIAYLQETGSDAGFNFNVRPDARNSTRNLAEILQGGLGLPDRDYYFKDDERSKQQREAYLHHVAGMFSLLGEGRGTAGGSAQFVLAIETELARASMTAVERRDPDKTYNKMDVEALAKLAPGFAWREYFDTVGAKRLGELNVAQPAFFTAFARLAAERPAAEWRAYLRYHLLKDAAPFMPRFFQEEHYSFYSGVLKGVKAAPPRHRHVLQLISGNYGTEPMAQAIGMLFVERAFPPEAKAKSLALVGNVKAALGERLRKLEWMGEATQRRALEKLEVMAVKIGYPDRWRDFSDAPVGARPFVENFMVAAAFERRRKVAMIGQRVDRTEWFFSPHIVNAFYNPRANEIAFPAGILQPPFFDAAADDAVNYGAIGMVIGHEITHGFDDSGRKFDAQGNLKDWWSAEDARRYEERAQRVVKQFDAFEGVEGLKVNGKLTLGENISDLGGLKIAYLALQKALEGKPRTPVDGLSPEQRFFLSYAQSWRSTMRPEQERLFLQTDGHSPPRYRVRGPLENMPEFATAFGCDASRTLRPESERANIW
jgi:putative endopeptidase